MVLEIGNLGTDHGNGNRMALADLIKCRAHRDRGGPGITHRDRGDLRIAQEVALAKLTRIEMVLEELTRTEVTPTLLVRTVWPWQAF